MQQLTCKIQDLNFRQLLITDLPGDVLNLILGDCDMISIFELSQTCKQLRNYITNYFPKDTNMMFILCEYLLRSGNLVHYILNYPHWNLAYFLLADMCLSCPKLYSFICVNVCDENSYPDNNPKSKLSAERLKDKSCNITHKYLITGNKSKLTIYISNNNILYVLNKNISYLERTYNKSITWIFCRIYNHIYQYISDKRCINSYNLSTFLWDPYAHIHIPLLQNCYPEIHKFMSDEMIKYKNTKFVNTSSKSCLQSALFNLPVNRIISHRNFSKINTISDAELDKVKTAVDEEGEKPLWMSKFIFMCDGSFANINSGIIYPAHLQWGLY